MGFIPMAVAIVVAFAVFGWSATRRFRLLTIGAPAHRTDRIGQRISHMIQIAFLQWKMPKYKVMGPIHMLIFWGFLVLLINTLILWGRAFDVKFDLWVLGDNPLGHAYHFVKDIFTVVVLVAAGLALLNRVVLRPARLTASIEAGVILLIIITMMVADLVYSGWQMVDEGVGGFDMREPFASLLTLPLASLEKPTMDLLGTIGYWAHSVLVLIFLNLLPYGKHFHVVTSIPNVFLSNLDSPGKLPRDETIEKVLKEEDTGDGEPQFGVAQVQDFTWKDLLDMYSCTECGRCTDNCPAAKTNKPLKPKTFLTNVRGHLYERQNEFLSGQQKEKKLIPDVVDPEVVWSCTTCRACEEECPVTITYVEKFVKLRRDLVEGRGEPPAELAKALRGIETNSNPWNISRMDRAKWTEGLEVPAFDADAHEYLFFVGCASSFDDRAKRISRSFVKLLEKAGVKYGILGTDEPCCGETARRAGSESVFRMTVDANVEAFKELGVKKIVTGCPHCFNTFKNEYPELGLQFEVVHHSELLARLVAEGKLKPTEKVEQKVVYHDGCYLGRYNGVFSAPRQILHAVPGLVLAEVKASQKRGLCCGGGGARFFMEEHGERVNSLRTKQLLEASPKTIATACPYCMTMISDGLKEKDLYDDKGQVDVAEILAVSCGVGERKLLREEPTP
ncbi:MAG: heterodisulfide reductase-related iron-sulfur binding cluster [Myxococcota bacterium]|nr:heterodisulfide reductase-related iron-sulfur binding cluster [Myxococcota bacterium]